MPHKRKSPVPSLEEIVSSANERFVLVIIEVESVNSGGLLFSVNCDPRVDILGGAESLFGKEANVGISPFEDLNGVGADLFDGNHGPVILI